MIKATRYECEYCGKIFDDESLCEEHEEFTMKVVDTRIIYAPGSLYPSLMVITFEGNSHTEEKTITF